MDPDLALSAGIVIAVLALPPVLAGRPGGGVPRGPVLVFLAAAGLALWALTQFPAPITPRDIPDAMLRVIARIVN